MRKEEGDGRWGKGDRAQCTTGGANRGSWQGRKQTSTGLRSPASSTTPIAHPSVSRLQFRHVALHPSSPSRLPLTGAALDYYNSNLNKMCVQTRNLGIIYTHTHTACQTEEYGKTKNVKQKPDELQTWLFSSRSGQKASL